MPRCPGQDMRYWTAKDIFDVSCPYCDNSIEFWKDEPFRLCRICQKEVRNPRIDLGCAKWCKFGSQCLGRSADEQLAAAPVIEKLKAQLKTQTESQPQQYEMAMEIYRIANLLLTSEGGDPCRVKTGALLVALLQNENQPIDTARRMLQSTILPVAEQESICQLLTQVLASEKNPSLDASVVSDALVLAGSDFKVKPESIGLITAGAKMIYALQFSKKATKSYL
jgi:hypothetical protein